VVRYLTMTRVRYLTMTWGDRFGYKALRHQRML
jgi:hypothetical protein